VVTHDPLHGSGRAALPHPALASGNDAWAAARRLCSSARCASGRRGVRDAFCWSFPLGQSPSLHLFRRRLPNFVRRLLRYYGTVRLPAPVHHRRTSLDFPTRPAAHQPQADIGSPGSRARCFRTCSGSLTTRDSSASRHTMRPISPSAPSDGVGVPKIRSFAAQYPGCTCPCQRFGSSLRSSPHDSGSAWVADPSPYGSFIHYTSPVYPGAPEAGVTQNCGICEWKVFTLRAALPLTPTLGSHAYSCSRGAGLRARSLRAAGGPSLISSTRIPCSGQWAPSVSTSWSEKIK
jgi:hypothetical protein